MVSPDKYNRPFTGAEGTPDCEHGSEAGGKAIGEARVRRYSWVLRLGDFFYNTPSGQGEHFAWRSGMDERKGKKMEPLKVKRPNSAGVDVGSQTHYVAVPPDRTEEAVRHFGCLTPDLHEMARWLKACGVQTVAMESTGVYWIPVAQVLEDHGLEVCLVDARHVKNVSGRKTDVKDCQWLQELHSYGLLGEAFRPTREMGPLRSYWRQRSALVEGCSQQIHLMHKALEQMNLQLQQGDQRCDGGDGAQDHSGHCGR